MPRKVNVFSLLYCLALVSVLAVAGCRSAGRSNLAQNRPARLWDASKTAPLELAGQHGEDMAVQFASIRKPDSSSAGISDLLTGPDIRIPLPESESGRLRQIDPPQQAGGNTIGAF